MPCKFCMIFYGIFEDFSHWNHCRRGKHQATRVEDAPPYRARPPVSWAPGGPPPLMPAPTRFIFYPEKSPSSSSMSSSSFCCDFRSPCSKHLSQNCLGGDCSLVCDSSIGPISFCSSALFFANLCCIGDHVLELACQIYMVPSSSNAWYRL